MKNSVIPLAAVLGMVISAAPSAWPQTPQISVWKIDVRSESGESLSHYSAEIYGQLHQRMAADLGLDNTFEFRQVPCGQYLVVVHDASGIAVHQEFVSASASEQPVTIQLPRKEASRPPSGPVSATELRHPPARKAVRAAQLARRFLQAGEFAKAAQQFRKAIDISPEYALAYSGLAASYLRTGNYREAASEASRAMELSQPNPADLGNLALAQFQLGRIAEATVTVRRWLAMTPENAKAHWMLGLLLARDRRTLAEAAPHLERAAEEVPEARPHWEAVRNALAASEAQASR